MGPYDTQIVKLGTTICDVEEQGSAELLVCRTTWPASGRGWRGNPFGVAWQNSLFLFLLPSSAPSHASERSSASNLAAGSRRESR